MALALQNGDTLYKKELVECIMRKQCNISTVPTVGMRAMAVNITSEYSGTIAVAMFSATTQMQFGDSSFCILLSAPSAGFRTVP